MLFGMLSVTCNIIKNRRTTYTHIFDNIAVYQHMILDPITILVIVLLQSSDWGGGYKFIRKDRLVSSTKSESMDTNSKSAIFKTIIHII